MSDSVGPNLGDRRTVHGSHGLAAIRDVGEHGQKLVLECAYDSRMLSMRAQDWTMDETVRDWTAPRLTKGWMEPGFSSYKYNFVRRRPA
jgi:hypothetical protein